MCKGCSKICGLVKKTHKTPYKYIDMIFDVVLSTQSYVIILEYATIIYDYAAAENNNNSEGEIICDIYFLHL